MRYTSTLVLSTRNQGTGLVWLLIRQFPIPKIILDHQVVVTVYAHAKLSPKWISFVEALNCIGIIVTGRECLQNA